jgi:murein DD-endopeptidase MepM/ murein hydrolase activator NlpD
MKSRNKFPQQAKDRSVLILSPEGKPLRSIRINFLTIMLFIACAACGFAALLMPSSVFRFYDTEGYKKIRLNEQNRLLQERITSASQMVKTLEDQIGSLEGKKKRVSELLGENEASKAPANKKERSNVDRLMSDPERLVKEVLRWEGVCLSFLKSIGSGNPFDTIPVCSPVMADIAISQKFGKTNDPFTNRIKWHYGIDYAAAPGTEVIATASGMVIRTENDPVWGKRIIIRHGRGMSTKYAHLGVIGVRRGQTVRRGEVIGVIGTSGLTTGPHVHYEVWYNSQPVDPESFYFPGMAQAAVSR